jgi:hypothetical protein
MSSLNLSIASPSSQPQKPEPVEEDDDEEEEESQPRGKSLGMVLLMSYASAVTIALIWVLWSNRRARENVEAEPSAAESRTDSESTSDQNRRSLARPAIGANHLVGLGETVRLGLISVTPVSVSSGAVTLVRNFGDHEKRSGGKGALKLRLRLKNLSEDSVIAPLDVALLRPRPGGDAETVIETGNEDEPYISMYSLALESEWSIQEEEFRDLEPGSGYETTIVSAPGATAKTSPAMTWRVRLQTDSGHFEDLGVRFRASEIKNPKPVPESAGDSQARKKR